MAWAALREGSGITGRPVWHHFTSPCFTGMASKDEL